MEGRLCPPNGFASSKSFSDYAPAVHIIMILFTIEWSAKFLICPLLSANQIQQKDTKLLAIIAQKDYLYVHIRAVGRSENLGVPAVKW